MEHTPHPLTQKLESISNASTRFIGSIPSLVIHTIIFVGFFISILVGFDAQKMLLFLTTIVSLEAIYLSIFIQMSVNRAEQKLGDVSDNINEIHDDIEDIQEDIDEVSTDIDEIQKDVDEMNDNIEEIQEDIEEVTQDIEDIQEDIEEEFAEGGAEEDEDDLRLSKIEKLLAEIQTELKNIKK